MSETDEKEMELFRQYLREVRDWVRSHAMPIYQAEMPDYECRKIKAQVEIYERVYGMKP